MNFSFPNIVSRDEGIEYIEGGIESAVFAVSFYIINYSNNIFNYTIYHDLVYTNYSITIPVGNYDYQTLFSTMITLFDANGHHFDLTINELTGRMTMFYHQTSGQVFYRINHSTSTCFRILGFDINTDYFPSSNTLLAPFPLNLLGIKKLKISCPQFSSSNLDSAGYATTDLILTIINDQPPFSQINYYNNSGEISSKLTIFEINIIDIRITDEYGALINFNNTDWSMTLILNIYRRGEYNNFRKIIMTTDEKGNTSQEVVQEEPNQDVIDLDFLLRDNPDYFL